MSGVNKSETCSRFKANRSGQEIPAVLAVGGHDPSGGAGLIVDAACIRAGGGHPLSIPAVLTLQSGLEFIGSHPIEPELIRRTWRLLMDVFDIRAVKTGALANAQNVETVASLVVEGGGPCLVVDPVMESTSGGILLDDGARRAMMEKLFPLADVVTPNLAEAGVIAGISIEDTADMERAAEGILCLGPKAVLIKGGHLRGEAADLYRDSRGRVEWLVSRRVPGPEPRGTGCALASFISVAMAHNEGALDACFFAKKEISKAVANAMHSGKGPPLLRFF